MKWSLIAAALLLPAVAVAEQTPALFSIAVGYNHSPEKHLGRLKYADDDAVGNHRLMRTLGAQSALLAHLDPATKALHGDLAPSLPTPRALDAALDEMNRRIDAARRAGRRTVLYLFYSGHGEVHQGEGYVQLHGGRLARTGLIALLRRSRAHVNHVVVDACKSYFLVFERGTGGKRRRAAGRFLPREDEVPRNTGFLLSTSSAQDSHEWEAFGAGIFSHEVRSALRGAADANGDRRVTYEEAAAFVYTANRAVANPRYRPRVFARPHKTGLTGGRGGGRATLVDLRRAPGRRIVFAPTIKRRFFVEDRAGVRLADLHPGGRRVSLLVPRAGLLFVRDPKAGLEYPIAAEGKAVVALAALQPRAASSRARGAEHESFRLLFRQPFDPQAVAAYRARPDETIDDLPATSTATRWLQPALGIFAVAALATGGVMTGLAARERGTVERDTPHRDRLATNDAIDRYNAVAVTSYVVGAAAAAGYLLWRLWPARETKIHVAGSQVSFGLPLAGQARLQVRW